jgi:hypothetical protein
MVTVPPNPQSPMYLNYVGEAYVKNTTTSDYLSLSNWNLEIRCHPQPTDPTPLCSIGSP